MEGLEASVAQARALRETEHRPYPVPERPWTMGQTWQNLLFAHWPVSHDVLRPHVPDLLELEQFDGSAWVGLTPFRVTGLRLRGAPPLPFVSSFYELNCRTYVRSGDRPGIWFFSLDASNPVAVAAARRTYRLPYRHAQFEVKGGAFGVEAGGKGSFRARYHPAGEPAPAARGTLEYFLVERYCLYAGEGELRADIHHAPWPLQPAEAEVEYRDIAPVELEGEPICHFARRQDVVVWWPEPHRDPR